MPAEFLEEMKRYVRFGPDDESALRALAPHAAPHFQRIADEFYQRLQEHEEARKVLSGPEQIARLQGTLCEWMTLLLAGPWDTAYFERRARIGRMHVRIALPQRYMFGAMDLIRISLGHIAMEAFASKSDMQVRSTRALEKIIDLELAIMLETYREAFVEKVQHLERLEKNLLERRLAISEAKYEEIVEKAEALIVTFDKTGSILLFNRRCEDLTGLERGTALGMSFFQLFVPEEQRAEVEVAGQEVLRGERSHPYEGPVAHAAASVRRVRWHFTTLPSVGEPVLCAIGIDVTDEHDMAVRTGRAERLASLGTMAAGLAHEIRNPLNAASLQLTLLQRRLARPKGADIDAALAAAGLAESEMKRLALLVEEFLHFARPQPLRLSLGDLRSTASVIVRLLLPEAAACGTRLTLTPGPSVPVELDDERMKQVILNLLRNALEAAGTGGHVTVTVDHVEGGARLRVEDSGPGLTSLDAPIFEPFFTTKPGGTGLGLAIVYRIVSDHGGSVGVESQPGRTLFSVTLPTPRDGQAHILRRDG